MAVSLRSVARRLSVARISRPSAPLLRPARPVFAARFQPLRVNSQIRPFTSTSYLRQEAEAKPEAKANGNGAAAGSLEEKVKQLETQLAEKEKQLKEYQDRYVRAMAEIENVRRIGREDVSKATKYGVQSFAKALLTVADEMQLAIQNFPVKGDDIEKDATAKAILEGLRMTEKTLLKVLEQNGVSKMVTLGAKFDANCHDAIFQVDDDTKEPGTVAQVLKEGFMMKDRCLRPATVGVVKKRAV